MEARFWKSPLFVLLCCFGIILTAYGCRQSFGMFVRPVTEAMGWGADIRTLSFSTGLQSLIYGLCAPFTGAIADRFGPIKVLISAALLYAFGMLMMTQSTSPEGFVISIGLLTGVASSGIAMPILLSVAGRVASEQRRTFYLGVVTSGATAGQMLIVPLSHNMISVHGWVWAATMLACMLLLIVPLAAGISHAAGDILVQKGPQSLREAIREARGHRGFWLLVTGFFVCGFQVQFINNHLENYLNGTVVGGAMAATAISLIGLFNMIGTWSSGLLGARYRKKYLLSGLYALRSLVFLAFFLIPVSKASVMIFACSVGLLWLATVPLTSGIVSQLFGPRYLATLYGVVFLSHQIGSFTSVYLGGIIRNATGSYDFAWWMIIIAGFVASLIHAPIDDKPVARLAAQQSA
jgi:predicted MFS family arabinose efflux permease